MARLRKHNLEESLQIENLGVWLKTVLSYLDQAGIAQIQTPLQRALAEILPISSIPVDMSVDLVEILSEIKMDVPGLIAAFIFPIADELKWNDEQIKDISSSEVLELVRGVQKMEAIHHLRAKESALDDYSHHLDNLRKMLVAMTQDIRVVLIKLSHCIALLEAAKKEPIQVQQTLALEAREVYAPLANRLGVGHLKWQLEDLSFRYLEPEKYAQIAKFVSEKRLDREKIIAESIQALKEALLKENIHADVLGRIKHIYSIWRKMQRKNIQYEEVYDVRAVRIIVDKISDCYGALGVVHGLWSHIPKEFDDYIASPKPNGYRSLHTAVVGPGGKIIEVQIRTYEMNEESELGVCAHWAYKEGKSQVKLDYNKVKWLKSLLAWQEEVSNTEEIFNDLKNAVTEDRVYVFTPKGEVIDLPKGSTPLDFAYHVHTDLGHRTRGAKINGKIVPLTTILSTGEQVEILAQKEIRPGKDWLYTDSGYLFTSRARSKVRAWFREQNREDAIQEGKNLLEKEFNRLDLTDINIEQVSRKLNFLAADDLFAALGHGDIRVANVIQAAFGQGIAPIAQPTLEKIISKKSTAKEAKSDGITTVEGVGNLMTTFAHCCNPLPGDDIVGYLAVGKGISIHKKDCLSLHYSRNEHPEKMLEVEWGQAVAKNYPVKIVVNSYDRKNLLRDITSVLSAEHLNVIAFDSQVNSLKNTVTTYITLEVSHLSLLSRVLDKLQSLPNIIDCSRVHETYK